MTVQNEIIAFDEARAEAFANRFVGTLNEAALAIMTSLGHRAGLFDALAENPGLTSDALALKAGVNERYLREWLGVMVTSGVVAYDPHAGSYTLPPEHAAFLTRAAAPDNMAVTTQFIGVAASVENEMLERFRTGEGLCYGHFDRFHEVMAEDSAQLVVASLVDAILPVVPGLIDRLKDGIDVADFGCGGGRAMLRLAREFPHSRFFGFDLCADAFAATEAEARAEGLENLAFESCDLSSVQSVGRFDLVTAFDAVHDQKDPKGFLALIHRSLRKGGVFLMQDIGGSRDLEKNIKNPFAPLLYTISSMHCTPISIGQGGPGLGAMWGVETAQEYLAATGFASVETHRLPHDPINAYFVARP
ncbi:transcriptional regulator (plasmid) [Pseudosulfitobacter pseudonitzschiae]|uniref:Transcriptional regulator n=1 Tax=Pseudosulfitobacter pseudonitzschiae TaxID=1402135 RepID=A0A221K8X4_9RHOB|nr:MULTISPECIES: methyltransferase domain-containing protein [Roseobacteraceae]ASM75454.1 transcriptional regulator [Pseudosulfitobacter pseudonitzschiae]